MLDKGPEGSAPPRLHLAHSTGHRARLRADPAPDRDTLVALADRVASIPGVSRALARPGTGSLIIETHKPVAEVLAEVTAESILRLDAAPEPPPVDQVLQMALLRADMGVKDRTGGALDFRTAIALALAAGALFQLTRGRVAGPATTLAMGALSLIDRPGDKP